jgi:hypothetical protein
MANVNNRKPQLQMHPASATDNLKTWGQFSPWRVTN